MYADPKIDPGVLRDVRVLYRHTTLDFGSAPRCVHSTGKFNEYAITGRFDDSTSMGSNGRVNDGFPGCL